MEYLIIAIAIWAVVLGSMIVNCCKGSPDPDKPDARGFPEFTRAPRNDQAKEIGRFVEGFKDYKLARHGEKL